MKDSVTTEDRKTYWWIPLFSGLFLLLFGIWFLVAPIDSFQTLTVIFGIVILLSGILEIYFILKEKGFATEFLSYIWGGVLSAVLGVLLIANPKTILIVISILIGFWLIYKSGEIIKKSLKQKKENNKKWRNNMFLGVMLIIVAIVLLWHPEIIGFTIAMWTSFAFIVFGVLRIYLAIKIKTE